MDNTFITTALVGTGQQKSNAVGTGTPVDGLVNQLNEDNAERRLLLSAGAWSIYRRAGQVPQRITLEVQPAPPEALAVCSLTIIPTLQGLLLGQHSALLPEALARLQCAGLRLPHELLPAALALGTQKAELRAALVPVAGERGRWLSQHNSEWRWCAEFLPGTAQPLPDEAETIWQEGTLAQRGALLRRLRTIDAEQARQWLAAVWKQEKVDARCELLATFEVGLSAEDEPWLEKALDDRAERVRTLAASLLASIPTSALAQRMRARADAMLNYAQGVLHIVFPQKAAIDEQWQRDGIAANQSSQTAYLIQVLSLIPPRHWLERFSVAPATLLLAAEAMEDGQQLIESWSYAATLFADATWAAALWPWWCEHTRAEVAGIRTVRMADVKKTLAAFLPQREAEQCVERLSTSSEHWDAAIECLPRPWSREFGAYYLQTVRQHVAAIAGNAAQEFTNWQPRAQSGIPSLEVAALALPFSCFAAALEDLTIPASSSQQVQWLTMMWQQELQKFSEIIHLRKRLIEEIRL